MMMDYRDAFGIDATLVSNDFLENYMPKANGEYVKVYLYIIKNRGTKTTVQDIAEGLELTEGDVKRAIKYWKDQGVLIDGGCGGRSCRASSCGEQGRKEKEPTGDMRSDAGNSDHAGETAGSGAGAEEALPAGEGPEASAKASPADQERAFKERLAKDEEFSRLLVIAQKYMSKIFTPKDTEVFGYLYDELMLPVDVLDYLVDYCVQGGHNDIRYIEKTGLNWAAQGIRDLSSAVKQTKEFDRIKREAEEKNRVKAVKSGRIKNARPVEETDYDALALERSKQALRKIE